MLHSEQLTVYGGSLSPEVEQALVEIKQYFEVTDLKVLSFDEWHIVVPVTFNVSLPSNGPVNNVDIRVQEAALIRISLEGHPNFCPFILSDRKDFPKAQLSHLYFTEDGEPASLCLVRDSPNEWFSRVKMSDFLDVGQQWFYKAGAGLLNEDGDEFDPTRVEGNVWAKHIYKYDILYEVVSQDQRLLPEYPMAIFVSGFSLNDNNRPFYRTTRPVPFIVLPTVFGAVKEVAIAEKQKSDDEKANPLFSVLLWHPDNKTEDLYLTSKPSDFSQLKTFFSIRGIDIVTILNALESHGILIKCGVPIIYAMRRPRKVIGYNGEYEFFNFVLIMPEGGVVASKDTDEVAIQSHIEPFSSNLANYIAGHPPKSPTLYIGAGSLGSKLILHDARSGNPHIGVVDNKQLLHHNLARHELFAHQVGKNKAKAIIETIKRFYTVDNTDNLIAYDHSVVLMTAEEFEHYHYIIDSTASQQVSNYLTLRDLPANLRYFKSEIAHDGKLGLCYVEGKGRNPRMDDLMYYTCFLATKSEPLLNWRISDAERKIETLNIGLGCSSSTAIMPDDLISLHASIFSRVAVKLKSPDVTDHGLICVSSASDGVSGPKLGSEYYQVEPVDIIPCRAGSNWNIRMLSGFREKLLSLCADYAPVETGGVLVGIANYKTRVIHVFDIITEPQDSEGTCMGFTRGIKGLPQEIDEIKRSTGGVIGYIGEWHTHPMNLKRLSQRDLDTIAELRQINSRVPIPTCAMIVTPDEILAFVYE